MKIFVLSLKNSPRRGFIQKQLQKQNVEFEFFDAVNGKELSADEISKECDEAALEKNPRWLNRGAIGCALSHLYIYKRMVDQKIDKAIIMEDDMLLNSDFLGVYKSLDQRKLEEEVIMIYYRSFDEVQLSKVDSSPINSKFEIVKPYSLKDIPATTGCYYITNDACSKLIHAISPIQVTADSWKHFILNSEFDSFKVIFPRPISDAGFQSDIDYHTSYSNKYIKGVKEIIDKMDNKLINVLAKKRRKRSEKKMSKFSLTSKESILKNEKNEFLGRI